MSYCVNCGVELADDVKACPLCGVPVINPAIEKRPSETLHYPQTPMEGYRSNYRDLVGPIAIFLLIPVLITIICNWLTSGRLSWSVYVVASIALADVFILLPLALRRPRPVLCISADCVAIALFLWVLEYMTGGAWFFPLGLPLVLLAWVFLVGMRYLVFSKQLRKLVRAAGVLLAIALFSVCAELFINLNRQGTLFLSWSIYIVVPCVILALIALLINRNRRLKEEVKRRFYF